MRSVFGLVVATLLLAACTAGNDNPGTPVPTMSSPVFTPSRVSVAPPPATTWTTATRCPSPAAAKAVFGSQTRAQDTNEDVGGIGCVYRIGSQTSIEVTVVQSSVAALRETLERPPSATVRDAPELAPGALVAYTPPGGHADQCLVAVDHSGGSLIVQVSARDAAADRQRLCTPLGPMLRLLSGR